MKETICKLLIIGVLVGCFTVWIFADLYPGAKGANGQVAEKLTETIRPGD